MQKKIYLVYFDEDFGNVVFNCNEMNILNIDLNCINFNDDNFDKDDPDTIIHVKLLAWHTKFENDKALKKQLNEKLMSVAWYSNTQWDW